MEGALEPSLKLLHFIRDRERFLDAPYRPTPNDVWTIGYGHTGTDVTGRGVIYIDDKLYYRITQLQAEALLERDVNRVASLISRYIKAKLTQEQFDACCDLAFNIGVGAFSHSEVLSYINLEKFDLAVKAFTHFETQAGKVLGGLVARRQMEMNLFDGESANA